MNVRGLSNTGLNLIRKPKKIYYNAIKFEARNLKMGYRFRGTKAHSNFSF